MSAVIDRIMFAIVFRVSCVIDVLRGWCAMLEERMPAWAKDEDIRLLVYGAILCAECMIGLAQT